MSVHAYAWAWQVPNLEATDKLVLLAMCEFADSSGLCWPAHGTLARMTGRGRATVQRSIDRMVEQGVIFRQTGTGRSNTYRLDLAAPRYPPEVADLQAARDQRKARRVPHGEAPGENWVPHGEAGGASPDEAGGASPDEARTVMNRYEPSGRSYPQGSELHPSGRYMTEEERSKGSERIAEIRAAMPRNRKAQ